MSSSSSSLSSSFTSVDKNKMPYLDKFYAKEYERYNCNSGDYLHEDRRGDAYCFAINLLAYIGRKKEAISLYDQSISRAVWKSSNKVIEGELEIILTKITHIIDEITGKKKEAEPEQFEVLEGKKFKISQKENIPPEILEKYQKPKKKQAPIKKEEEIPERTGPKYFHYR
jgi:hypothetical protein